MRLLLVGVDLDRKALAGEDIFGEKREVIAPGKPDLADPLIPRRVKDRRELSSSPRMGRIRSKIDRISWLVEVF